MLRAAVLSLILLAAAAATLPAGEWLAEAALRSVAAQRAGARRHTRAWWRRYRARLRRRRSLAAEQRRRRWALRTSPSAQSAAAPRLSLPDTLKPAELPGALPSSLDSISTIERQVAPPEPVAAATARPTETAPAASAVAAPPETLTAAPPVPQPERGAQARPAPALAHVTPRKLAGEPGAAAINSSAATPRVNAAVNSGAAPLATPPAAAKPAPRVAPAQPRLSSPLAPAPSLLSPAPPPLAHVSGVAPASPSPLAKASADAPALAGRDPHKFSPLPAPRNWLGVSSTLGGEYKFSLRAADGRQSGVAVWSRVNLPAQGLADRRNRAIAGVAHASLRRTVIDRMLLEGGWVVNDFERDIAGRKVFVVVAQSESGGLRRAWTYYFVELDGRLFSLATTAPAEFADSVAAEAEQTLSGLAARRAAGGPPQAGRDN
jgi:hypothetical protein